MSEALDVENTTAESLMGEVVNEFLERLGRGERPDVEEYARRYPQLAAVLRQMLPALELLRSSAAGSGGGSAAGAINPEGPLGDFRIVREVGRGGMGVVYEAVQISLGRRVALKVLPFAAALDGRQLQRFKNEAQAAAHLHHQNIVPVHAVGCERGVHYYAMQFIEGRSLAELIHELRQAGEGAGVPTAEFPATSPGEPTRPEPPAAADTGRQAATRRSASPGPAHWRVVAGLGVQAAEALEHAHGLGVIHRDIKPANLMLDVNGNLWVADFGLAQVHSDTRLTRTGDLVGTLRYMSPEQALARRMVIDHRSDIYALGATLYELLTFEPVFTGRDHQELLKQIAFEEPRPPRRLNPAIPTELETIVLKALAKAPEDRYQSAADFADDLNRFLRDEPIRARRPTLLQRARKWSRRHRPVVVAAAASAVLVLLTAVAALAVSNAHVREEQKQTREALERERQVGEDLERALYFQRIASAEGELGANNIHRAEELLEECPFKLRGWEWHYLKRRRYQAPLTFRGHKSWVIAVAFSPDGKYVASGSFVLMLGQIKVWERKTGRVVHTLYGGHVGPVVGVAFSPDGKYLASAGWDATAKIWDVAKGELLHTLKGHSEYLVGVAFSPDGKLLATASGDRTAKLWDTNGFQELHTLVGHRVSLYGLAFSPDSKHLATASGDRTVRVWDTATGRALHVLEGHAGPVLSVAYGPDGKRLASAAGDGTVKLWDPVAGRHLQTIRASLALTTTVAFSPNGRRLATGDWENTVKIWDLATYREALTLRGHTDWVTNVSFSPDGLQIASASLDKTVRVWDATPLAARVGDELLTLRGHRDPVTGVAYQPGGKLLATASFDHTVKLWDAATGEEVRTLTGHASPLADVAFSRDGRRLVSADIAGGVKVWDAATGREIHSFRGYSAHVALSPDGRRLASALEGAWVYVWDADTGKELLRPFRAHAAPVLCLAFSPNGKLLVTGSWDSTARVWDAATGKLLHTLSGHTHVVYGVTFSADGKRLVTASWDGSAKIWEVASGKELVTLRGNQDRLLGVAISPNGKLLATASWFNTVIIWNEKGEEITTLRGDEVSSVAFSPDGKRLATGSGYRGKGEVKIWDATRWEAKAGQ